MICVVDASVAVKWFVDGDWALREDHVDAAAELLKASIAVDGQASIRFLQPPHFMAEVAAVLVRLCPELATSLLADLAAMDIDWAPATVAWRRAVSLSRTLDHHLFDTLYHALAIETPGAVMVTADRRYFDKASRLGSIAWLPDFRLS